MRWIVGRSFGGVGGSVVRWGGGSSVVRSVESVGRSFSGVVGRRSLVRGSQRVVVCSLGGVGGSVFRWGCGSLVRPSVVWSSGGVVGCRSFGCSVRRWGGGVVGCLRSFGGAVGRRLFGGVAVRLPFVRWGGRSSAVRSVGSAVWWGQLFMGLVIDSLVVRWGRSLVVRWGGGSSAVRWGCLWSFVRCGTSLGRSVVRWGSVGRPVGWWVVVRSVGRWVIGRLVGWWVIGRSSVEVWMSRFINC